MPPIDHSNLAFALARDLHGVSEQELGSIDPAVLTSKLHRIRAGLSAEHEFAAIASWLGKCSLLTQPDQIHVNDGTYRVPDFLVAVRLGDREIPFLVEVKSKTEKRLVWSESYLDSLRAFADLLQLPLLVAWKPHGMWVMVDTAHFEKRQAAYHLTFATAMKNNLMSHMFGNAWLHTSEHFRFEIGMQILDPIDPTREVLPEGTYNVVIREAAFWTEQGKLPGNLAPELFPILLSCGAEPRTERTGDRLTHVFPTQHDSAFNLSDLLISRLMWGRDADETIDWSLELGRGVAENRMELDDLLRRSLQMGVLQYVLRQQPEVMPPFLQETGHESGEHCGRSTG